MRIVITTEEAVMLEAFKTMRKMVNSSASNKSKEKAINQVFWSTIKSLDKMGE